MSFARAILVKGSGLITQTPVHFPIMIIGYHVYTRSEWYDFSMLMCLLSKLKRKATLEEKKKGFPKIMIRGGAENSSIQPTY